MLFYIRTLSQQLSQFTVFSVINDFRNSPSDTPKKGNSFAAEPTEYDLSLRYQASVTQSNIFQARYGTYFPSVYGEFSLERISRGLH